MNSTQHGGSANISGVFYQTLWTLLRALQIRVKSPIDANTESEAMLVLEPKGGGGDLRVGAEIEQLKAKSDGGKWSLQTVVTDVLPDLFMAVDNVDSKRFRFVTEGTMGDWMEVYRFFRRLENVAPPADPLSRLDDNAPLPFRTTVRRKSRGTQKDSSIFNEKKYTERGMFCLIRDVLKGRSAIRSLAISESELMSRLWRLLGGFEFVGGQDRDSITNEIDRLLLAVVDRSDAIPQIRAALAISLTQLSAAGNVTISAEELFRQHNLNATPLTNWSRMRSKCQDELQRILANNQYDARLDVRLHDTESIAELWANSPRALVITGESGQGKTWTLAALASYTSRGSAPVLWVEASGNAREDLDRASHQFWLDMRGGEQPIPLRQIVSKLIDLVPTKENLRLRICLDNVNDYGEAAAIVRDNWPSLGISVAMCCPRELASSLLEAFRDKVYLAVCNDFSWEQLHELLERRVGDTWPTIPDDVRETLRRPLLASIYLDELEPHWHPTHEYELFSRMWRRLSTRQQAAFPLDATRLESLAERVLSGEPYPWSYQQLQAEIDDGALQRLERSGWLSRCDTNHFHIFHNRLLNWAVAQSLVSSLQNGKRTVDDFMVQVVELNRRDGRTGQVFLGYVPMDVLWLVCGDPANKADVAPRLLQALEATFAHQPVLLYRDLVPTLGERVADPLFARFRQYEGLPWVLAQIAQTLARIGKTRIAEFSRSLLTAPDPHVQRRGLQLLRETTCPSVLDELWRIHAQRLSDPGLFLGEGEKEGQLKEDSWAALRKSAANEPAWIVEKLKHADSAIEPVHDLAWLIVNLANGKPYWDEVKNVIFQKVAAEHPRVFAKCIGSFRDTEYVDWLRDKLAEKRDLCGPVAIRSLSRIDPIGAAVSIARVDLEHLHLTSYWSFREVWLRQQHDVERQLLVWAGDIDNPWEIGLLFRHFPNDVPAGIFARMLEHFERRMAQHLASTESELNSLYTELSFLAEVVAPRLVELLEQRRGATFEVNLTECLRRLGARKGLWTDSLAREPGVRILRRINGRGFTRLVNEYLQCDDRYGRLDAWEWSVKAPDDQTFQIAVGRSQSDELWDQHPLEQNHAIRLLAVHCQWEPAAMGVCRLGLKTHNILTDKRLVPKDLLAGWLHQLREQLNLQPTPGNVMGLAFAGDASDASSLRAILSSAPADAELGHACVIGLEMLGDKTDEGVRLAALHLGKHRYSVTRMLTRTGTPAAWDALWRDLQNNFNHITALNLMNLSTHADKVLELTTQNLPNRSAFGDWDLLRILILNLRPELKKQLLEDRWLRDTFHREAVADEGNSWLVGSKAGAIECLAEYDPKAAYEAAAQALGTVHWHDRERYPYLLLKIDSSLAVPTLLDRLESESSGVVRYAIGRALSSVSLTDILTPRWESQLPEVRASACFAGSWAHDGGQFEGYIRRCLDDSSETVIEAAIDALNRLRQKELVSELRECATSSEELVVKWRYIDDLIDCMDPGDDFQPWPEALSSVCKGLSPIVLEIIGDRLKKRQKKLYDELKKVKQVE